MAAQGEFFIHTSDTEKNMYMTRRERIKSNALSPCEMGAEDVEYEMSQGKHREILRISGMNQEGLAYFAEKYGKTYRYVELFKCHKIKDLSPLSDLTNLERLDVFWNTSTDTLWDMSGNVKLDTLWIMRCKKISWEPKLLQTAPNLKHLRICGDAFNSYPIKSLDCFAGMPSLQTLTIYHLKPESRSCAFLDTLPNLQEFNFDPGMFTMEEIAKLVAKYPTLRGECMGPTYRRTENSPYVRLTGWRKPEIYLPDGQKRMEKHISKFNALVDQYRQEAAK